MRTITIKADRCVWLMFMNDCPVATDVPVSQPVQKQFVRRAEFSRCYETPETNAAVVFRHRCCAWGQNT
jgi:hypothetical protein